METWCIENFGAPADSDSSAIHYSTTPICLPYPKDQKPPVSARLADRVAPFFFSQKRKRAKFEKLTQPQHGKGFLQPPSVYCHRSPRSKRGVTASSLNLRGRPSYVKFERFFFLALFCTRSYSISAFFSDASFFYNIFSFLSRYTSRTPPGVQDPVRSAFRKGPRPSHLQRAHQSRNSGI